MALSNISVAEEALALPLDERIALAKLIFESLDGGSRTDEEIKAELKGRLNDMLTGQDQGLTFHEVFKRPL